MRETEMFVVGRLDGKGGWWFQGLFSSKALAVNNCEHADQFVCPIVPDLDITGMPGPSQIEEDWPGAFFPVPEELAPPPKTRDTVSETPFKDAR